MNNDNTREKINNIRIIGGSEDNGKIFVQSRNIFPGLGRDICTRYPIKCAVRSERGVGKGHGHRLFYRHLICKKLDDLFLKLDKYLVPHVGGSFGSGSRNDGLEFYIYEWTPGHETFPWEVVGDQSRRHAVKLDEWQEFSGAFHEAGIDMERGISMPDSRNSQNIIHGDGKIEDLTLNADWKRIDFDEESVGIDYQKLAEFLTRNQRLIIKNLGEDRFWLLIGALKFLADGNPDMGDLAEMTLKYRLSALDHSFISS